MKSIAEILGGYQMVFGISFDIQEVFEGYVTAEHRMFIQMLPCFVQIYRLSMMV